MRIVLDFPQAFVEAFPFVGFPILVLVLLVREEVFGSQEGTVGINSKREEQSRAEHCR